MTHFSSIHLIQSNPSGKEHIYLSTVQLVESSPGSAAQVWHADSAHQSLTVVVALSSQTVQCGPTQLIADSHRLFSPFQSFRSLPVLDLLTYKWGAIRNSTKPALPPLSLQSPCLKAGAMLIFESRLLHRGLPNNSTAMRPILVLRFDRERWPPPGMTTFGAMVRHVVGLTLQAAALLSSS